MSDRSQKISKLLTSFESRTSYIRSKLGVLVPSQIRSLRLKSAMPRQSDLAREAKMQQSRISMFETPGSANLTLDTLSRLASAFKVGLIVKFVPFSEMLRWENEYSQDTFNVTRLADDTDFLQPAVGTLRGHTRRKRRSRRATSTVGVLQTPSASGASTNIPVQQERGTQLKFQFELPTPAQPSYVRFGDLIVLPKRSVVNDLPLRMAAAGAGGNYANR